MSDRVQMPPFATAVGRARGQSKEWTIRTFDAGRRPTGTAGSGSYSNDEDNPTIAWAGITVEPAHRRQGVATALLTAIVEFARGEGRTRLVGSAMDDDGGPEFASAIGAVPKQAFHMYELELANVDVALMEQRIADAAARAPGYELLTWEGPCPEEHAEAFVDLTVTMNDSPRDELSVNEWRWSVAEMRRSERALAEQRTELSTIVVRSRDGEFVAFNQGMWNPADPTAYWTASTAVRREHRGRGLQKWMGAERTLRLMVERPGVTRQRMSTSDSNDPIIVTSTEKGYRPIAAYRTWEVQVSTAAAWLGARGRKLPLGQNPSGNPGSPT